MLWEVHVSVARRCQVVPVPSKAMQIPNEGKEKPEKPTVAYNQVGFKLNLKQLFKRQLNYFRVWGIARVALRQVQPVRGPITFNRTHLLLHQP